MEIAQLFITLAVHGADKTVGALGGVEKGLKGLSSLSLEAKAGILAAGYALEQLFSKSGQAGTDLSNFNAFTGGSIRTLQQYQYAARQVGVSNDETANTFKNLQSSMSKTFLGKGAPGGLAEVARLTGGSFTREDVEKYMKNPELLIQRLQDYSQKEKNIGRRNEQLKTFGLSDSFIAALGKQAFNPNAFKAAPTYSDREVNQLDRANIAWSNLGSSIQMAIGHFNSAHGLQLVSDITKLVGQVVKLTEAFVKLAEAVKLFQGIGKAFEGWTAIFSGITDSIKTVQEAAKSPEKAAALKDDLVNSAKEVPGFLIDQAKDIKDFVGSFLPRSAGSAETSEPSREAPNLFDAIYGAKPSATAAPTVPVTQKVLDVKVPQNENVISPQSLMPVVKGGNTTSSTNTQNVNVNQTLNFSGENSNRESAASAVKKAVLDAFRQLPSQVQGS